MKSGSTNFRSSAISDVMELLIKNNIKIILYEPLLKTNIYNVQITQDLERFKMESDIIIANRKADELHDVDEKIFSRDIYNLD
jgi:UDPglucose 6-dehydrogenase